MNNVKKKIFSDSVSEQYRKYVIKIITSNRKSYYLLWGTDVHNEDFDYLLLNTANNIIAFSRIKDLLVFVNRTANLVDEKSVKKWVKTYKANKAYVTYNFLYLLDFISEKDIIDANEEYADKAISIIDFFNLFSDYSQQTNRKDLLKLCQDNDINILIDYLYMTFFWRASKESCKEKLNKKIKKLDFLKVEENIKNMVYSFEKEIVMIGYPFL